MSKGSNIIVLMGRSAGGKTAIANMLQSDYDYQKGITCTTRNPRPGEVNGRDYNFMSHNAFVDGIRNDIFIECDKYRDKWYGMQKAVLETDNLLVAVLTPEGAKAVKELYPDAFIVEVDTSMKTAVIRAVEREENLDPGKLQTITKTACTDYYLYDGLPSDFKVTNESGSILEDVVKRVAKAHKEHMESCDKEGEA